MYCPSQINPFDYDFNAHYEHRVVYQTLERFGLQMNSKKIKSIYGNKTLKCDGIYEFYPSFPILLAAYKRVGERPVSSTYFSRLFTGFDKSELGIQFRDHQLMNVSRRGDRAVGLVFPYRRFKYGFIIHDGRFEVPGKRVAIRTSKGAIYMDRYLDVLKMLVANRWNPEESNPFPQGGLRHVPRDYDPFTKPPKWVTRWIQGKYEARLLWALYQLEYCNIPEFLMHYIQRRDGYRYVVITVEQLGYALGYANRRTQLAISKLEAEGFLESERGFEGPGNPCGYRVNAIKLTKRPPELKKEGV